MSNVTKNTKSRKHNVRQTIQEENYNEPVIGLFNQFIGEKKALGLTEDTIKGYTITFNKFYDYFGEQADKAGDITSSMFIEWTNHMSDNGLAAATINHHLGGIRPFMYWCMEDIRKYIIDRTATIKEALVRLDKLSDNVLTLFVIDGEQMVGTLTDGDIRRALIRDISFDASVEQVMNKSFKYVYPIEKDIQKIRKIRASGVQLVPCLEKNRKILKIYNLKARKSILPVDVVLMAGGLGLRLRPLTENIPKPLLPLGDKVIIDFIVDSLISYGIENIHVTTNYLAEMVEQHFKRKREGIKINCVREKEYLGTIASIKNIPNINNDDVLVMNSDLFTNIDFEDFYHHFLENNADMTVAAIPHTVNIPYGILELDGHTIMDIKEKPTYNYYANAGIYLIKKKLLDLIPNGEYFNATDFMNLLISKGKNVTRYLLIGYWIDIGKFVDYQKAQEIAKHL